MPFIDFDNYGGDGDLNLPNFDFTIIGCGAVGIHIALKLARQKRSVLIIESGKVGEHADRQMLNQSTFNREDIGSSAQWGRKRALGGTTIRWGGQALPFMRTDVEARPWLNSKGWPLTYDELVPFYPEAERYMGLNSHGYFNDALKGLGIQIPFVSEALEYHISKWAPEPNMFKRHQRELEKLTTVLYNAHCLDVDCADGQCQTLRISNYRGKQKNLKIKRLILSNGGLESVRFLLLNHLSESPSLGKGFMEHPCMDLGSVSGPDAHNLQKTFSTKLIRRKKYGIRLSLSENIQRNSKLTNASASLMFETPDHQFDPLRALKSIIELRNTNALIQVIKNSHHILKAIVLFLNHRVVWKPNANIRITTMCEQLASNDSTLELDLNHVDPFGMPRLKITWNVSEHSWNAAKFLAQAVKSELEGHFNVDVQLRDELLALQAPFDSTIFSSVNHHMGGASMGKTIESSVVDNNLKVHGIHNLWVCSAAVFPSGSHSNPTLTALALGGRLVEHLSIHLPKLNQSRF